MTSIKEIHVNIKIIFIITVLQRISNSMFYPFIAIFIAGYYSLKITSIILLSISIVSIIANLIGGGISEYIGNKKVLLLSEITKTLSFVILFGFIMIGKISGMIIICLLIVNNFCMSLSSPINQTIMITYSEEGNRKKIYTLSYWLFNLSVSIGVIIGSYLFEDNLSVIFLVLIISSLICSLIISIIKEESSRKLSFEKTLHNVKAIFIGYKKVLADKTFILFVLATFLFIGMEVQFSNYISIYINENFASPSSSMLKNVDGVEMVGYLRIINTVAVILLTTSILKILKSLSDNVLITIGTILFTVGTAMLLLNMNIWYLVIATIVFSLGEIIYGPPSQVILSKLAEGSETSKYLAFENLIVKGSVFLGSIGVYLGSYSEKLVISFIVLLGLLSIIFYVLTNKKIPQMNN